MYEGFHYEKDRNNYNDEMRYENLRKKGASFQSRLEANPFKLYSSQEKRQMCYQHCVLKYVNHEPMTNASLRQRLAIETKNSAQVSCIIKDALSQQMIKLYDLEAGPRQRRYIPFWA